MFGACAVNGTPVPVPSSADSSSSSMSAPIRQTDNFGRTLPFETNFPNRWNINNDGSSYEPCTQIPVTVVREFGLEESTVSDVAASDFQTARGCRWRFQDDRRSSLAQSVGNLIRPPEGLGGYKGMYSSSTTWFMDTEIDGRPVLVGSYMDAECGAIVRSGDAVVITSVLRLGADPPPPTRQTCDIAVDFLRATLDQIPI
ncbi:MULTISPECIES: DUF3558 family protein [Gordonia]|uniref:DUF3558 family protein n=1 Tax=Gordonia TaxID=2053 RepID=UPI0009910862|nr:MULTISPECIES: DUF3558 family protein [unclassified Gordonia (in: high G+C Gram-positive bacteria)]MBN0975335.1 DUF3558 domain-containing protein [Gordonia sp. BP-119]MBN0985481.1 DUF3558 domain-containing protein [Gordonia sp. BP-94]